VDIRTALDLFSCPDEKRAQEAFNTLCAHARKYLYVCLKDRVEPPDAIQDVIQETLIRIWKARKRFRNEGPAAFFSYLKVTAYHCWLDIKKTLPLNTDVETAPPEDWSQPDDIDLLIAAIFSDGDPLFFFYAATVLFCGLDPSQPKAFHERQLLAAQLYYLDNAPVDRVIGILNATPGNRGIAYDEICEWLADPGVQRHLAYVDLFLKNEELARYLLELKEETPAPKENDPRLGNGCGAKSCRWTPEESLVLLWRYRYGMTQQEISQRTDCPLPEDKLKGLCDRSAACFPFGNKMEMLLRCLGRDANVDAAKPFRSEDLWQRLAFQYRYHEHLPYRDICERTQPAASPAGYEVKPDNVNMWLGGRRLLNRFTRFYQQYYAKSCNASHSD
jgi:DNA-directed RNA polymerase specialized sigma24 family protein